MAEEQESHCLDGPEQDSHGRKDANDPTTFIDGGDELRHQLTIYLSNAAIGTETPISSCQTAQPNDMPATTTAQISSQFHGRPSILRSVSSRFVEDLPEFQPFSPIATSPHRRRFRSSPAILGTGSRANNESNPGTNSRSTIVGNLHQTLGALQDGVTPVQISRDKQSRSWKTLLLVSAYLSIVAFITNPEAHSSSPGQQQVEGTQSRAEICQKRSSSRPEGLSPLSPAFTTAISMIERKPLKLKKRPPSEISNEALRSRRGSTYKEWRREMKSEVSAHVSRRSSRRSQKSTASRVTRSTVRTKSTSRRRLFRANKRCNALSRFSRSFLLKFTCRGGRTQ